MTEEPTGSQSQPTILRIIPSQTERSKGTLESDMIDRASRAVRANGALILDRVIDTALIESARRAFGDYANPPEGANNAIKVGDKRLMIDVALEPPFDDPALFANPWLLPILENLLGKGFVVGNFGCVCSQPGARKQHKHNDGGILFDSGVDVILPAVAVTVGIPLLDMNDEHGTTALWLGSHRNGSVDQSPIEPVVPTGSIVLWDFRLAHCGTENRSSVARPLLYVTYCRPWWIDHRNFVRAIQTPIRVRKETLARVSEDHRRLLARTETF